MASLPNTNSGNSPLVMLFVVRIWQTPVAVIVGVYFGFIIGISNSLYLHLYLSSLTTSALGFHRSSVRLFFTFWVVLKAFESFLLNCICLEPVWGQRLQVDNKNILGTAKRGSRGAVQICWTLAVFMLSLKTWQICGISPHSVMIS